MAKVGYTNAKESAMRWMRQRSAGTLGSHRISSALPQEKLEVVFVDMVNTLDSGNFRAMISSEKPVLVDFWAAWCGPCKMIAPVVEEIAQMYQGKLDVGKLNVDENGAIAAEYGVMSIPTLLVFKGGKEVARSVGYKSKDELAALVNSHL